MPAIAGNQASEEFIAYTKWRLDRGDILRVFGMVMLKSNDEAAYNIIVKGQIFSDADFYKCVSAYHKHLEGMSDEI